MLIHDCFRIYILFHQQLIGVAPPPTRCTNSRVPLQYQGCRCGRGFRVAAQHHRHGLNERPQRIGAVPSV